MDINFDEIKNIDVSGIATEDIKRHLENTFKDVFIDDVYVARMTNIDYNLYNQTFETSVEEDALYMYEHQKEKLLKKFPGKKIESIIGFLLSQKLYEKECE